MTEIHYQRERRLAFVVEVARRAPNCRIRLVWNDARHDHAVSINGIIFDTEKTTPDVVIAKLEQGLAWGE